jgi:hypothetical protein
MQEGGSEDGAELDVAKEKAVMKGLLQQFDAGGIEPKVCHTNHCCRF